MTARIKYNRTFHLPWSLGRADDDKVLKSVEHFVGRRVVVTEKLDGENTTIYSDGTCHARSLDSASHESQAWVRALAAQVGHLIPKGWRVCGENVFAFHSIPYDKLTSYFYVFGIYDENNVCLSWRETIEWAALLGLEVAPVIYESDWCEHVVKRCFYGESAFGDEQEGYVVRVVDSYHYDDFGTSVAKFVREQHVQPNAKHWRNRPVVPNTLRREL